MKKLALAVMVVFAFAQALRAQDLSIPQRVLELSGAYQPFTLTSTSATQYFLTTGMDAHAVTYTVPSTVTGVTVTVSGSTDGGITWSTIGSSTKSADTISFTGTYSAVRVVATSMTAAMPAIAGVYNGTLMAGHAVMVCAMSSTTCVPLAVNSSGVLSVQGTSGGTPEIVQTTPNATYPTAYAGLTDVVLSTTSGTVGTATTVLIGTLYCVNQTASAATMMVTNTAGTYIVGGSGGFSIPANSDVTRNFESGKLAVGIKWWSGTASAILCSVTGWQ